MAERLTLTELEGQLENLVKSGRRPLFVNGLVGSEGKMTPLVFCLLPPEGTQFGDSYYAVDGDQGVLEFISPQGEVRGLTELYELTPEKAATLQKSVETVLNALSST